MKVEKIPFIFDDGGRSASGKFGRKRVGDCVVRALAIAMRRNYAEVHADLWNLSGSNPDSGVQVRENWFKRYMEDHGFLWTATMCRGSGCRVHLNPSELPSGRIVVRVSKHLVAMVDGVIHDNHDCSRAGMRCVYGYWKNS